MLSDKELSDLFLSYLGSDLRLLPCTTKAMLPFCLQLMLACFKVPKQVKPVVLPELSILVSIYSTRLLSY